MVEGGYSHIDIMDMFVWQRTMTFLTLLQKHERRKQEREQQ